MKNQNCKIFKLKNSNKTIDSIEIFFDMNTFFISNCVIRILSILSNYYRFKEKFDEVKEKRMNL